MFETNISGHKNLGPQKIGDHCPRMSPLATGLLVKQKFRTWMKLLLHYVFD